VLREAAGGGPVDAYWVDGGSIWIDYVADYPGFGHDMGASNYIANGGYLGNDPSVSAVKYIGPYAQNSKTTLQSISDDKLTCLAPTFDCQTPVAHIE